MALGFSKLQLYYRNKASSSTGELVTSLVPPLKGLGFGVAYRRWPKGQLFHPSQLRQHAGGYQFLLDVALDDLRQKLSQVGVLRRARPAAHDSIIGGRFRRPRFRKTFHWSAKHLRCQGA
jgi:hypothetical protein